MNIQEYQAKAFFKSYDIPVLNSQVIYKIEELDAAIEKLGGSVWVVKAQVLAGGRGKAGGVKLVKSLEEAKKIAKSLLGSQLVTHQTDSKGEKVSSLLIEEGASIEKEYYLSLLLDPKDSNPAFIVSPEGGMDIEEVSENSPEKILKVKVDFTIGLQDHHVWAIADFLGLSDKQDIKNLKSFCQKIYRLFHEKDVSLLEINPLIKESNKGLIALDGKMGFDENALYRHKDLSQIFEKQDRAESEKVALEYNLSFIELDGSIGCMVNGAGLAMATMDIIKLYGAKPANFLDVGGGASEEKVIKAFEIILKSKEVKAVLVNIFGGIMRCDVMASGLIKAVGKIELKVPIVIRLEGTKAKEGLELLEKSNLPIITARSLDEAAKKAVEVSKK